MHPHLLANHLKFEALIMGAGSVALLRRGNWWILCSDTDWLGLIPDPNWIMTGKDISDLFNKFVMLQLPEPYHEWVAGELVAHALAETTITLAKEQKLVFGVELSEEDMIWQYVKECPYTERIVAFKW